MARPPISELADADVSESLDREIRGLLTSCFNGPEDGVFAERRFWKEPPAHRWIMRNAGGDLIAHLAAHDKSLAVIEGEEAGRELLIAGIAEVAVHPAARGMGHAKELLTVAHSSLERKQFHFAALFGRPEVYRSSGYRLAENLVRYYDTVEKQWREAVFDGVHRGAFMWRPLNRSDWPEGTIDLRGPKF